METEYPTILRRYLATFIDWSFIILIFIASSYILHQENKVALILRIGIAVTMFLIYEPICTSKFFTLGQWIMRIRVRKLPNFEKVSILSAYIRIFIKIFLGLISFFTIPITKGRRAIHDFAVGSIVIDANYHQIAPLQIEKEDIKTEVLYTSIFLFILLLLAIAISLICRVLSF